MKALTIADLLKMDGVTPETPISLMVYLNGTSLPDITAEKSLSASVSDGKVVISSGIDCGDKEWKELEV